MPTVSWSVLKDPVQTSETGQRLCRECCETATELVFVVCLTQLGYMIPHDNHTIQMTGNQ